MEKKKEWKNPKGNVETSKPAYKGSEKFGNGKAELYIRKHIENLYGKGKSEGPSKSPRRDPQSVAAAAAAAGLGAAEIGKLLGILGAAGAGAYVGGKLKDAKKMTDKYDEKKSKERWLGKAQPKKKVKSRKDKIKETIKDFDFIADEAEEKDVELWSRGRSKKLEKKLDRIKKQEVKKVKSGGKSKSEPQTDKAKGRITTAKKKRVFVKKQQRKFIEDDIRKLERDINNNPISDYKKIKAEIREKRKELMRTFPDDIRKKQDTNASKWIDYFPF